MNDRKAEDAVKETNKKRVSSAPKEVQESHKGYMTQPNIHVDDPRIASTTMKIIEKKVKDAYSKNKNNKNMPVIILVEPNNPGNIGAISRVMGNFGFYKLVLVNPRCDYLDSEARNRAKHSQKILDYAKVTKSFEEACKYANVIIGTSGIPTTDFNVPRSPLLPEEANDALLKINGNYALVFGREDVGLSVEEIRRCDFLVRIPTDKEYPVLNLSQAVGILLYAFTHKNKGEETREKHKQASQQEKEQLIKIMNSLIDQTKFRTESEKETQFLVWKKIIGKSMPTRRELYSMIGFLKKQLRKK